MVGGGGVTGSGGGGGGGCNWIGVGGFFTGGCGGGGATVLKRAVLQRCCNGASTVTILELQYESYEVYNQYESTVQ